MEHSPLSTPGGRRWTPARPAQPAPGPPGLAALLDAERTALRDHHERLQVWHDATHTSELRTLAHEDALRLQADARRQTRGMRDRLRARENDRRLLAADARSVAVAARASADAARMRVRTSERRLAEIRALVDSLDLPHERTIQAIRRTADLPDSARSYATIAAFISENGRRALGDPRLQDLIGQPLGDRWTLEEPDRPWITSRWRALWSSDGDQPTGEVYAIEHAARPHAARRVWLLGTPPPEPTTVSALTELTTRQSERNSLALLASTVRAASTGSPA